ncbi:MAG: peroxidase [Dehalococcoidia bacterium]
MKEDYRSASIDGATRALLDFAVMVTRDATKVTPRDLDALRGQGFRDEDILDAVEIIGFFNYYARMANALGVEPEPHWAEG